MIKLCIACGADFLAKGNSKTCSDDCALQSRREKKRAHNRQWAAANPDLAAAKARKDSRVRRARQFNFDLITQLDCVAHAIAELESTINTGE